jgi:hypothetical protein
MSIIPAPGNKKASRDFQDRGWLVEGVCALYQVVSTSFSNFAGPLSFEKKKRYVKAK